MRLTHLEIIGFKSFAQKVHIPFGPGITAIVGPNGCGKSNIVEAIRWVMGEQRAGVFRSQRMEEVIFGGARQRKPLGMAEVILTIENTNNILPIEFSEVNIARRLFRSGESDYLLNKIPCRLLDIHNLLMDTGLGQGAYAVIEQGMVDEIISEKTENRRRILEEAAGITKYKVRRRSTWSRLESTNADLMRLEDIIVEVKRQVDYMSRQVGRARRYQEMKAELDEKEVLLGHIRFFATRDELQPLKAELEQLNRGAEEGYTRFTSREAELEKLRLAQTEAERALQNAALELNRYGEQIHERERQLVASTEQLNAAAQIFERSTKERQDSVHQLQEYSRQQETASSTLAEARRELEDVNRNLEAHKERSEASERSCAGSRTELDSLFQQRVDLLRAQGELSRGLERLVTEREGLTSNSDQLRSEISQVEKERQDALEHARQSSAELEELNAALGKSRQKQQVYQARADAVESRIQRFDEQRGELRRGIDARLARLHAMEKVQSGYEGYSSGVRTLLLESPHADLFQGILGDLIEVDTDYFHAVESALGESLEALVAPVKAGVLDALHYLKEHSGRAGVFPLEWTLGAAPPQAALPETPGLIGPLLNHVRADEAIMPLLARLLHNTFLVEDLAIAMELAERYPERQIRLVTPAGEGVDLNGRIAGGRGGQEDAALLGRRQEIRLLKTAIAHENAQWATLAAARGGETQRKVVLSLHLEKLSRGIEIIKEQEREKSHLQQSQKNEIQRLQLLLDRRGREQAQLQERSVSLENAIDSQREKVRQSEQASTELDIAIRGFEEHLQEAETVLRTELDQLATLRAEQARIAEQTHSLERDEQRLHNMRQSLQGNIERLANEIEQATSTRQDLAALEERLTAELKDMHGTRDEQVQESNKKREHWDQVNTQTRALEGEIGKLQRQLNAHRDRRHQLELQIAELDNRAKQIQERLLEDHHCDVASMGRPESGALDLEELASRVEALRQSIQRLGTVHVGVLEEYEEQKERYDFLCHQRDDLLAAAEDLKKTLSLIDRTARRIFRATFEEIRQKFKETFVRFFPGGEADLQLEQDVDALEASIDIIARPRGKRLQSITLLSGGEKALTAIALLFSIYLVKPSPFCILDEVDAPLDDANIDRFLHVLKEFARSTQFIMVTHNKLSMHAADTLHGVTMPEEGVSQLVSVRMEEEVLEEAAG